MRVARRLGQSLHFVGTCVLVAVLWVLLWAMEKCFPDKRGFLP